MQITTFFVSALLAASSARAADRATEKECHKLSGLERMQKLAANDTMMAMVFENNATKVADFKAKAAAAQPKLAALQANATLVGECAAVNAVAQESRDCRKMAGAEKMIAFAANDTALQTKFKNNQTKIDAFKAKAKEAETKLTALQGNATLTSFCAAQKTQGDCRLMAKWQKMADLAKNQTALDAKFKGDETKVQQFQAKVTGFQAKLDAMMGNATLMDTCKTMAQTQTDGKATNNAAATDASKKSAAATLETFRGPVTALLVTVLAGAFMW